MTVIHSLLPFKRTALYTALITAIPLSAVPVWATPQQGEVAAGVVSISQQGSQTFIQQSSDNAIINWQQFSIDAHEGVYFQQPGRDSVTLNRIQGGLPSEIYGELVANGNVFLVNPNGILFGRDAQINVGGIVASTFNISDDNFLSGNYLFDQPGAPGASIENYGHISLQENGLAAFVAPQVKNFGFISATLGRVSLGATESGFALDLYGDELIRFAVSDSLAQQLNQSSDIWLGVENQGEINTPGGSIVLSAQAAREVVNDIVISGGELRATGVSEANGEIVLFGDGGGVQVAEAAVLDVSNDQGNAGLVKITGDEVYLDGQVVAVSQQQKGGSLELQAGWLSLGGTVDLSGAEGGRLSIAAGDWSNAGSVLAQGLNGQGGSVDAAVAGRILEFDTSSINVDGFTQGGGIRVIAGEQITTSSHYSANGLFGDGGSIDISAPVYKSLSAEYFATGGFNGGSVRLGGEFQGGKYLEIDDLPNAQTTIFSSGSVIDVSGANAGGEAILWSDQETIFQGSVTGDGAFVEISSSGTLRYYGDVSIGSGELLLDPKNIIIVAGAAPTPLELILGYDYHYDEDGLGTGDNFGAGVALDGTHLAVGAPGDDGSGDAVTDTGAVYLYTFANADLESPSLSAVIGSGYTGGENVNQTLDNSDFFGSSVALDGTHLAVGATGDDGETYSNAGAVYLYSFTGDFTSITEQAVVGDSSSYDVDINAAANSLTADNSFGAAVALDGGTIAIGAPNDDGASDLDLESGNVYLLSYTGDFATITKRIIIGTYFSGGPLNSFYYVNNANVEDYDHFGSSVALEGGLLAVGAKDDDGSGNGVSGSGAAYLYHFNNSTYSYLSFVLDARIGADYLFGNNVDNTTLGTNDAFGSSIALDGTNLVVGATGDDGSGDPGDVNDAGAVFRYSFTGNFTSITGQGIVGSGYTGGSNTDQTLLEAGDNFGSSVTLDGNFLLVGAENDDGLQEASATSGAVYLIDTSRATLATPWDFNEYPGVSSIVYVDDLENLLDAGTAVTLQANNDITVADAVAANNGGGAGGNLTLQAGRSILVNANITTDDGNLTLEANETAADGVVDADRDAGAANITMAGGTTINTGTGTATFTMSDGAGNTNTTVGSITLNNVTANSLVINNANSGSSVTDTGTLSIIGTTDINSTGANITLDTAANDFDNDNSGDALTVDGATVKVVDTDTVNIGTSNVSTLVAESGANLTLSGTVTASGDLGDGNDTAIVLATGANFIEGASGDLNPGAGRFIVYSANPSSNTLVDLAATPWYNTTYNSGSPAAVSGSGDRFAYTQSATLTVTADDKNRAYGDANPALTQTVTGYINSETSSILTGSLGSASTAANGTSSVAGGPYTITANAGTLGTDRNYNINTANGSLTVNQAALTVTADDRSKDYGANLALGTSAFSSSGLKNGETIGSVTLTSTNGYAANTSTSAGTYNDEIVASAATGGTFTAGNYSITYASGDLTIDPRALTVTADDRSKDYGDNLALGTSAFTSSGLQNGETIGSVTLTSTNGYAANTSTNAGTYNNEVVVSAAIGGTFTASNYSITYNSGDLTIDPAALTVTADDRSKDYGANLSLGTSGFTSVGLLNGETIGSVTLTSANGYAANTSTNASTYNNEIVASAATGGTFTASNYSITYNSGDLTIDPRGLTVTADDRSKDYGDNLALGTSAFTSSGLQNGETIGSVTLTSTNGYAANTSTNAGTYNNEIVASAATGGTFTAGNYSITYNTGDLTIDPHALTVTADDRSKDYGDNLALGTSAFSSVGLQNGETIGSVTLTSTNGYAANTSTNAGTYNNEIVASVATGGTFTASNYSITYDSGDLTIDPAALTITANDDSKTYDAAAYSGGNGVGYAGFVNGETSAVLGGTLSYGGTSQGATNAGAYVITPSGLTSSNYDITFANGTLTVNQAALTVTADDRSKDYGANLALGTSAFTSSGLVGGETIGSVTLTSTNGYAANTSTNAGTYNNEVVASAATGGTFTASNYSITYNSGDLTIDPRGLTVTADDRNKDYGDNLALGTSAFTSVGLQNGETIGSVTLSSTNGYAANTSTNAGTYNNEVAASAATGGTFTASNYSITYNSGDLTIDPRGLTVTADDRNKDYGDNLALGTSAFTSVGLQNGETIGSVTLSSTNGYAANTSTNAGTYNNEVVASAAIGGTFTASNYSITYNSGDLTIDPAGLTVTADDRSKDYGANLALGTSGFTSVGLLNGETIGSVTLTSANGYAANTSTNAGTYNNEVVASAATGGTFTASNYSITYNSGDLTIDPRALTVTADDRNKDYGDNLALGTSAFTSSGLQNGETIGSVTLTSTNGYAANTSTNAGTYNNEVAASAATGGTFTASNYSITYNSGDLTIDPRGLTVTADDRNKDYGDNLALGTSAFTSVGLQNGETIGSVTLSSTNGYAANTSTNAGTYNNEVVASAATGGTFTASNYSITYNSGDLTIDPAGLTVTADDRSKDYGANLALGTSGFTSVGLLNGETIGSVTLTSANGYAANTSTNAGTYNNEVVASAATGGTFTASNYSITYNSGDLTIDPRALTVTADDRNKDYGDNLALGTSAFTSSGLQNGETIGSVTLTSTNGYAANTSTNAGTYNNEVAASAATGGTFTASNYSITYNSGDLTIDPTALTITATDDSKTYDAAAYSGGNGVGYVGFVNGETSAVLGGTLSYGGTSQGATNAGGYTITPSGLTSSNYAITFANGTLTVNQAALTITADDQARLYGDTLGVSTAFTTAGLVGGETIGSVTVTGANTSNPSAAVGAYINDIVPSNATGGTFTAGNYSITYNNGDLTVNPRALTITADDRSKTYGDNLALGTSDFSSSGLQNGETIGSVTLTSDNGHAGNTATGVGTYTDEVIPSAAAGGTFTASNYTITYVDGDLAIDPAALTVTANDDAIAYDGNSYTGGNGVAYAGFVNGETNAVLGGALSFGGDSQGAVNANTYNITPSGQTSTNYNITFVPGTLTINPIPLTITADDQTRVYGDTLSVSTEFTTVGLIGAETIGSVTVSGTNTSDPTANVGTYNNDIVPSNASGGTFLPSNYTITYNTGDLTVSRREITITASNQLKPYGSNQEIDQDAFSIDNLANGETIGSVTLSSASGINANENGAIGTYEDDISISGATGGTFSTGNYTISYAKGDFIVEAALLTIKALDETLTYNGEEYSGGAGVSYDGFVGSDDSSILEGELSFEGDSQGAIDVGTYVLTPGGLTHGNYEIVFEDGTLEIEPAVLELIANDQVRLYGDELSLPSDGYTAVGLVSQDTIDSVTLGSFNSEDTSAAVGTYSNDILVSNPEGANFNPANYDISFTSGSLTIDPRPITVIANDQSKVYGNTLDLGDSDFTADNLAPGETIGSVSLVSNSGNDQDTGASTGLYEGDIQVSDASGGTFTDSNYDITYESGDLTIDLRPLTLAANFVQKTEGEELDPEFSVTITDGSLGASDALSDVIGELAREDGEELGLYDILLGSGTKVANYQLAFETDNNAFAIVASVEQERNWDIPPSGEIDEDEFILPPLESPDPLPEAGGNIELGEGSAVEVLPPDYGDSGDVSVAPPKPPKPVLKKPGPKKVVPKKAKSPVVAKKRAVKKPKPITAMLTFAEDGTVGLDLSNGSSINGISLPGVQFTQTGDGLAVTRKRPDASTPPGVATTLTVASLNTKTQTSLLGRYLVLDEDEQLVFAPFDVGGKDIASPGSALETIQFAASDREGNDIPFEAVLVKGGLIVKPRGQVALWLAQASDQVVPAMVLLEVQRQLDVHVDNIVTVYIAR